MNSAILSITLSPEAYENYHTFRDASFRAVSREVKRIEADRSTPKNYAAFPLNLCCGRGCTLTIIGLDDVPDRNIYCRHGERLVAYLSSPLEDF